jgi:hypothetical protein
MHIFIIMHVADGVQIESKYSHDKQQPQYR